MNRRKRQFILFLLAVVFRRVGFDACIGVGCLRIGSGIKLWIFRLGSLGVLHVDKLQNDLLFLLLVWRCRLIGAFLLSDKFDVPEFEAIADIDDEKGE